MSEPSKEAWDRAMKLAAMKPAWPHLAGQDITWLAVGLQALIDERDGANAGYCEPLEQMRQRAEAAEADAQLAWRRVTELQARCTELVLERRAIEAQQATVAARLTALEQWREAAVAKQLADDRYWAEKLQKFNDRMASIDAGRGDPGWHEAKR